MIQSAQILANPAKAVGKNGISNLLSVDRPSGEPSDFARALEQENQPRRPGGKILPDCGKVVPPALPDLAEAVPGETGDATGDDASNEADAAKPGPSPMNIKMMEFLPVASDAALKTVKAEQADMRTASPQPSPGTDILPQPGAQNPARGRSPEKAAKADKERIPGEMLDAPLNRDSRLSAPAPAVPAGDTRAGFVLQVDRLLAEPVASKADAIAPVAATSTPMPVRPQEFASLVDRLVEAREMAGAHSASIKLDHADFGTVHLHFEQRDSALSVSMSSTDPDFNRAVTAAAASLPASAERDNSQSGSSAGSSAWDRNDAFASRGSEGQARDKGTSHQHRRDEEQFVPTAPKQRSNGRSLSRNGIFA